MLSWQDIEAKHGFKVTEGVRLADYCSYEVGGPADYFCEPGTAEGILAVLKRCRELNLPVTVIGKGSNLLISDKGVRGMVLCLSKAFSRQGFLAACPGREDYPKLLEALEETPAADEEGFVWFFSEAGASMIRTAKKVSELSLTGLEFACGIPGTVGGALCMNAGAYDGTTADVAAITYYLRDGEICAARWDEQAFGYRRSLFQTPGIIVLGTCYRLRFGELDAILAKVQDLTARREKSQPLELPSCGSVFKRPVGYYAGKLIMDSGLQGYRVGGAEVSRKHAGFIVNVGGATASDVAAVITHVRETVQEKFGVYLETEVRMTGDWDA